jgi:aspartate/methionine/tyrosine aminotransferase
MTHASLKQSRRMADVQSAIISVVGRWSSETPGTLPLGQGVVSYGPPAEALDALRGFPQAPDDHLYGAVEGDAGLISLVAGKLRRENRIEVDGVSRVVITAGGNQAFMNAILAIADPGDEVILQVPYYFNHEMAIEMASARVVPVPTDAACQLDLVAIEAAITPKTRAIVTISPNNPTGAVYSDQALRAVNDLCRDRGLFHISDEVYEYFTYDDTPHFSPGSITGAAGHTISLYSLSKAYGMASWRLGYMVIPEFLFSAVDKIQDTLLVCPPRVSQHVGRAALTVGRAYCERQIERLAQSRSMMAEALSAPGVPCEIPAALGAYYYFLNVQTSLDAMTLAERLVREHRVAVLPGSAFGATAGCRIRISYGSLDLPAAEEAVSRLVAGLRALA